MTRLAGSKVGQWVLSTMLAIGAAGCGVVSESGASDETDIDLDETDEVDETDETDEVDAGDPPEVQASIYDIQRPGSAVAPGTQVTLDGAAIRVTAVGADRFWMQEAGSSGLCDESPAPVEYRGIQVIPTSGFDLDLAIGQRVTVTGTVAELLGNTTLIVAQVTAIGEPSKPYEAVCDRSGLSMTSEALESVLVLTAGHTWTTAPSVDGVWGLSACFGEGWVQFGSLLHAPEAWSPSWHWVRGVVVQRDEQRFVMPRNAEDVMPDMGDDVCL